MRGEGMVRSKQTHDSTTSSTLPPWPPSSPPPPPHLQSVAGCNAMRHHNLMLHPIIPRHKQGRARGGVWWDGDRFNRRDRDGRVGSTSTTAATTLTRAGLIVVVVVRF